MLEAEPAISRRELSQRLCQENDWRSLNGNLREMSCRKALVELDRRKVISLPLVDVAFAFEKTREPIEFEIPQVSCTLRELGEVVVRPVGSRYAAKSRIWRSLLDKYHYLGSGPLCGAQIRYLVESSVHGPIGALAFTSASMAMKERDAHIGWTVAARRTNLAQVVGNARFLIPGPVQVPNLASHVLGLALARLADDWEERYAVRPLLVETFVDPELFSGACYKAANWVDIGQTAGRRVGPDTTTLDYHTHLDTEGLGPVHGVGTGGLGLLLHDTIAFTEDGTPLGVLDAQCWARPSKDADPEPVKDKKTQTIEDKESAKWLRSFRKVAEVQRLCPNTTLVSMGDRESDVWELFVEAMKDPDGPRLLVRSDRHRLRQVDEQEERYLWDFMGARDVATTLEIHIPHAGSRKARTADIDLRFSGIELLPPKRCASELPIHLWAVYLLEVPEEGSTEQPIEWLLLTTAPVNTLEDAKRTVDWYSRRWGIEVYHRTLKSGCKIHDRQLGTADRLEACLAIDMVVAWRIFHLTMLGRGTPDVPCTAFFEDVEWKTLWCLVNKTPTPPDVPPTMAQAVRMVARIGGHLGRKGDGPPGTQVLWRGLQSLEMAVALALAVGLFTTPTRHSPPAPVSGVGKD